MLNTSFHFNCERSSVWFLFPPLFGVSKTIFHWRRSFIIFFHSILHIEFACVFFSELNTQVWKCHKFFLLQIFQIRATITFNDNVQLHTDHLQADFKSVGRIDWMHFMRASHNMIRAKLKIWHKIHGLISLTIAKQKRKKRKKKLQIKL